MGRIHKPVFEKAGHEVIISGRTSSPSLEEAAIRSDITIVSVPMSVTSRVIEKVGQFCEAIMDFTTVKRWPIDDMLRYSLGEVGGLHPLYGDVPSIDGRTIVYCETPRSGEKCKEIVKCLEDAGAKIKRMTPDEHDFKVVGPLDERAKMLAAYAVFVDSLGITIEQLYRQASPPTRVILDLLARQVDEKNDEMYAAMSELNPYRDELNRRFQRSLAAALEDYRGIPERIRRSFGKQLKPAQERAKKLVE